MPIRIFNTLNKCKEEFVPLKAGGVKMYVCGPTVYGLTHIGNARPVVFFDVVRRYFIHSGFKVNYVSNFTDVDDKIINRAREEKKGALELAKHFADEFNKDMESLKVRPPDHTPRVTEFIPQIVSFIEDLVKNNSAYVTDAGEVLFSVRAFQSYGKLSGKNIDDLIAGARVRPGEYKKDPLDFSLWKPQKSEDEPAWTSPWGKGRPGWHIECSVMSSSMLGDTFDLHGGGTDLIHPHHENEIAQSEARSKVPFVRVWMHSNMINMGSEKMSKSLGNIFLTREFVKKFGAETLKYMILSGHYRSQIDFAEKNIRNVQKCLHRYYSTILRAESSINSDGKKNDKLADETDAEKKVGEISKQFSLKWKAAMDDDFNTAIVIGCVFDYLRAINSCLDEGVTSRTKNLMKDFLAHLKKLSSIINILGEEPKAYLEKLRDIVLEDRGLDRASVEGEIAKRAKARTDKDFKTSDAIRDDLASKGIQLMDSASGTTWDVTFQ